MQDEPKAPESDTFNIKLPGRIVVLVSGMRSMQDLVIMSYALVAWWAANRMTRDRVVATR